MIMVGFQYAVTATLNCQNIKKNPEIISKLKLLLINIIGKIQTFHHIKKIGKSLSQIIN